MQKTEVRRIRKDAKIKTARRLRKVLTKPELWLWLRLKVRTNEGLVFRNQHPIGPYILDFYCAKAKLCIEVDGEIHTHDHQHQRDEVRDAWLKAQGIHLHRVVARDLLASPDETTQGIFDLAFERLAGGPAHHASRGPPSP
jgi:very-short-patch-repair endonuclease